MAEPKNLQKSQKTFDEIRRTQTKQGKLVGSIQALAEVLNERATVEEILKAFRMVVGLAKETKRLAEVEVQKIKEASDNLARVFEQKNSQLRENISQDIKSVVEKRLNRALKDFQHTLGLLQQEQVNSLNFLRDKVAELQDGKDGKDADPQEVASLVRADLEKELRVETGKMKKDLEKLKKRLMTVGGGASASNLRIRHAFKHIAHTETPVGDIDGVNTTYTVQNNIWWIAGFTINGESIPETSNFTYSGKTITFTNPIPAVYSGKDFEIKYIG